MKIQSCDNIHNNHNNEKKEILEGYLVDIACIRTVPYDELVEFSREHTVNCAVMGHCMESGYGLVDKNGQVFLLDSPATSYIASSLKEKDKKEKGIKLRVERQMENGHMKTKNVKEINSEK
ncbi:MAG: hypothetical protein AB7U98_09350 [Candidatus Nitrosocosmicus sp.]